MRFLFFMIIFLVLVSGCVSHAVQPLPEPVFQPTDGTLIAAI